MSGKFMKVKRIIVPTITMVIMASQLMGCAAVSQTELLQMINNGDAIEIEVAAPAFAEAEQGTESSILWEQLALLNTNKTLRGGWDDTLGITGSGESKNGILYVNAEGTRELNNTLRVALHNKEFQKILENESSINKLAEAAANQYADIDVVETEKLVYMGINGYFNLLPDNEVNYANPDNTIQRNEFMAMLFRAETPVEDLETDSTFESAVGKSDYNIYAQSVAESSYLDINSKSLNNQTYNGTITRAEAIYMLMNRYFADDMATVDMAGATFMDAKDGGNIATEQKFIEGNNEKDYWKSYELTYALQNPEAGLPTNLYKALVVAKDKDIIGSETRWDEALTKVEAIKLLVSTLQKEEGIEQFSYKLGTVDGYSASDEEPASTGSSMGEAEIPAVESDDFVVEEMDATMYAVDTVSLREGPSETDFKENAMISKGEVVAVVGKVTAYKGTECLWYQLNTGEFVSGAYLSDTQPVEESTEPTNTEVGESTLSDFTDEEIEDIFNKAMGGDSDSGNKTTTEDGRPFAENIGGNGIVDPWQ